ncbi:hypothetical protein JCM11491_000849 [Sporobolomyces phaffii]
MSGGLNGISPELAQLEALYSGNKKEWRYEMRRDAQEIVPGLYVGPFQPSWKLDILQGLGISHILCIAESREAHLVRAKFPEHFQYLIQEIRDADDQNLIRIFPQAQTFIDGALSAGGRVLVHCGDGISRSPAIVTAYIMMKTSLSYEDAFAFVQARRFCVSPRIEFVRQLEAYRPILLASQTVAADRNAQAGQRPRRRMREEDEEDDTGGGGQGMDGVSASASNPAAMTGYGGNIQGQGNGGMTVDPDDAQRTPAPPTWTGINSTR